MIAVAMGFVVEDCCGSPCPDGAEGGVDDPEVPATPDAEAAANSKPEAVEATM